MVYTWTRLALLLQRFVQGLFLAERLMSFLVQIKSKNKLPSCNRRKLRKWKSISRLLHPLRWFIFVHLCVSVLDECVCVCVCVCTFVPFPPGWPCSCDMTGERERLAKWDMHNSGFHCYPAAVFPPVTLLPDKEIKNGGDWETLAIQTLKHFKLLCHLQHEGLRTNPKPNHIYLPTTQSACGQTFMLRALSGRFWLPSSNVWTDLRIPHKTWSYYATGGF